DQESGTNLAEHPADEGETEAANPGSGAGHSQGGGREGGDGNGDGTGDADGGSDEAKETAAMIQAARERGIMPTPFPTDPEIRAAISDALVDRLFDLAPKMIDEIGVEPAEDFRERLDMEGLGLLRMIDRGESGYIFASGDYSGAKYAMRPASESQEPADRQHEVFLSEEVSRRLQEAEAASPDSPELVIVADVGGARGVSMSRLAKLYAEQVHQGKVAFVVSNFTNPPEFYRSMDCFPDDADFEEYERLLQAV